MNQRATGPQDRDRVVLFGGLQEVVGRLLFSLMSPVVCCCVVVFQRKTIGLVPWLGFDLLFDFVRKRSHYGRKMT